MVDFRIRVIADPSGVRPGTRVVERELNRVEQRANNLGSALRRALGFLGGGLLARNAVQSLASFSQELSTVGAITQATAEEFGQLEERAISLGSTTRFTATQAAEGLSFLARAGFSASEAIDTVDDTLQLAQAGALDLGRAADIASNVLTGFRLETSEAARVVDVLADAANSSNQTVGQLGDALKFVAPVAAGVGVEIEETTAAIAALSDAGLQASLAGTGLRRVIATLEQGTPQLRRAIEGTGVTLDDLRVSSVGLIPALEALNRAGIDTGTALQVFGQRGGPALEVLNNAIGEGTIQEFADQLQDAEGTAARIAETMDDNLNGAILATKSAFEGLILTLGQNGAQGLLRSFFNTLTGVLRGAKENIDLFISGLQGLSFVLSVALARRAIPAAISGIRALGVAIATNPVGALVTALTLATGALITFKDQITIAEDSTTTFGDVLRAIITEGRDLFQQLAGAVGVLAQEVDDKLGTAFAGVEVSLQEVLLATAATADAFIGISQGVGNVLLSVFGGIGPAIGELFFDAINGVVFLVEQGTDRARAFFNAVGGTARSLGLGLANFFREIDLALTQLAQGQFSAARETAAQAQSLLQNQLAGVGTTFTNQFRSQLRELQGEDLLEGIENPFAGKGKELGESLSQGFRDGLSFDGATQFILNVLDTANAQRGQAEAAAAAAAAQAALNAEMEDGTPKAVGLAGATELAAGETESLGNAARDAKSGLQQGVEGITDVRGAVDTAFVNAFGAAEDALVDFATTGEINFKQFVDGLLRDVARILARQAILGLINAFTGGAAGAGGAAAGALFGGGRASGGPVNPNQAFLVGEEGPELFVPPGAGNIKTAAETAGIAGGGRSETVVQAPPVNVSVVNVTDPDEVVSALNSPEAAQVILNTIAKNPSSVNQSLAR